VVDAMLPESFGLTTLDAIRVLVEAPGYAKFVYLPYNRIERKIRIGVSELSIVSFGAQISAQTKAKYFVAT
jgi:hypothetical protein